MNYEYRWVETFTARGSSGPDLERAGNEGFHVVATIERDGGIYCLMEKAIR